MQLQGAGWIWMFLMLAWKKNNPFKSFLSSPSLSNPPIRGGGALITPNSSLSSPGQIDYYCGSQ